jgi:hypothetical protein
MEERNDPTDQLTPEAARAMSCAIATAVFKSARGITKAQRHQLVSELRRRMEEA